MVRADMKGLDDNSPIYLQLRELVRNKIENGEYPPGTAIPSENNLAKTYNLNRLTVRNALGALIHEGMLKRVHGKGVFVAGKKIERDLETLEGFTQTMLERNVIPSRSILIKKLRPAGLKYGNLFNINAEDEIYYVKRVCYINNEPGSLEEIFIPKQFVPKLEGIDLAVFTFYEVYNFYGIKLKQAVQTLDITTLEQSDARILGTNRKQALILFSCISRDESDRVVEFSRTYTRPDKYSFEIHFHR
ncbi:transcriptional regulator [Spirochaetia bacterium]|nr:transcriptional regulator [Spirochaetia bacterium]